MTTYPQQGQQPALPAPAAVKAIIAEDKPEDLVKLAEQMGQRIARQVTTSQIRNVFGTVRQIEINWRNNPQASYRQTVLLRPKLSYAAARERGQGIKDLEKVLSPAIEAIGEGTVEQRDERFVRFVQFFEAILAYHKANGGI